MTVPLSVTHLGGSTGGLVVLNLGETLEVPEKLLKIFVSRYHCQRFLLDRWGRALTLVIAQAPTDSNMQPESRPTALDSSDSYLCKG